MELNVSRRILVFIDGFRRNIVRSFVFDNLNNDITLAA